MTAVPCVRRPRSEAERWSFAAFALATIGLALSIWFVFSSETDPAHVRWWLVAVPLFVTALPVLLPRYAVRAGACVVLAGWCFLTGFSIGMLLVPALLATVVAVTREDR